MDWSIQIFNGTTDIAFACCLCSGIVSSELKAMIQEPPGYHLVGWMWTARRCGLLTGLGEAHFAGIHGETSLLALILSLMQHSFCYENHQKSEFLTTSKQ